MGRASGGVGLGTCRPEQAGLEREEELGTCWSLSPVPAAAVMMGGERDALEGRQEENLPALCSWQPIAWGHRWPGG